MEAVRAAGVCILVGFALIMFVCWLTGSIAIERLTGAIRQLW